MTTRFSSLLYISGILLAARYGGTMKKQTKWIARVIAITAGICALSTNSVMAMVEVSDTPVITTVTEVAVGVGPGEEVAEEEPVFQYYEAIPLSESLQRYLWDVCDNYGIDYCFALATIEIESSFNPKAYHVNAGGSKDRGLTQVNSCWIDDFQKLNMINSKEDLYNPYTSISCGMYLLGQYVADYGNCEKAYAVYNSGNPSINHTKASRKVVKAWEQWKTTLYGQEQDN